MEILDQYQCLFPIIRRIKDLLPFKARLLFYNGLVLPLFDYADIVWDEKSNTTLMKSVQLLQNKAAKIILDKPLYSSYSEALVTLNWITLERRRFYAIDMYMFINVFMVIQIILWIW